MTRYQCPLAGLNASRPPPRLLIHCKFNVQTLTHCGRSTDRAVARAPALDGIVLFANVWVMGNDQPEQQDKLAIRELYPGLEEGQLKEAEESLDRYLDLALRIYDRIRSDPAAYSGFRSLTASRCRTTIRPEKVEFQ